MPDELKGPEVLAPGPFRYFGIRGDPIHELYHVVLCDLTSTQTVVHVLPEVAGKALPIDIRHRSDVGVVHSENQFLNLLPLAVGIGFVGFGLEFANQFTEFAFPSFPDSFHERLTGLKHVHYFIALQSFGGFCKRLRSQRPHRFENAVDWHEDGAIFLKVAHLESLVPEPLPHPLGVGGGDRQVFLGELFNELNEGEHGRYHCTG